MASPSLARLRSMYDGFTRGEFQPFLDLMADDVVWHLPGDGPFAGTTTSRDELIGRMLRQAEHAGGTAVIEWVDGAAVGDLAVVFERVRAARGDATLDVGAVVVYRFAGERVVEAWDVFDDQGRYDEFWATP